MWNACRRILGAWSTLCENCPSDCSTQSTSSQTSWSPVFSTKFAICLASHLRYAACCCGHAPHHRVTNTDSDAFTFQALQHTYLGTASEDSISVAGLAVFCLPVVSWLRHSPTVRPGAERVLGQSEGWCDCSYVYAPSGISVSAFSYRHFVSLPLCSLL
jgi:hypothetical protein